MKSIGNAAIGGPFSLIDHGGHFISDLHLRKQFVLVYFGFTFCPDVCPTELNKMAVVLDKLGWWFSAFYFQKRSPYLL